VVINHTPNEAGCRSLFLSKSFMGVIIDSIPHNIVGRSRQFMGYCLSGEDIVGFTHFALIEAFGVRAVAARKVGGLDKSPTEILIAVLAISLPLLFIVGEALRGNQAAVRGEVSYLGETVDITGLKGDSHGEYIPDSFYGFKFDKFRLKLHRFEDCFFNIADERG
jgi:hypothetical protein